MKGRNWGSEGDFAVTGENHATLLGTKRVSYREYDEGAFPVAKGWASRQTKLVGYHGIAKRLYKGLAEPLQIRSSAVEQSCWFFPHKKQWRYNKFSNLVGKIIIYLNTLSQVRHPGHLDCRSYCCSGVSQTILPCPSCWCLPEAGSRRTCRFWL